CRLLDAHAEKDPGIVDENVETAEVTGYGRDRSGPILLVGNVEMDVECLASGTLECAHGLAPTLVDHVRAGDPGSRCDHQPRRLGADPARRPRNQSDLAIEPVHCHSS